MTRARSLSLLANANILTAEQTNNRVGIGSTIPDAKLDVDGDIVVGTAITIGKVSGIVSATDFYVDGISITGAAGTWATFTSGGEGGISTTKKVKIENGLEVTGVSTFSGNLTVGGVLSYADVTNVDSVGIVTARSGIEFGASGVGGTVTAVGNATFAGIVTAASFRGDGSQLSGVDSSNLVDSGDTNRVAANTSGVVITGIATATEFLHVLGAAGTSGKGIEARSNSTQSTDTNKAIRVRNNSDTDTFSLSYRGAATFGGDLTIPDYIVHSGDSNTKFGFESGDTITAETGGSERLRITSSGRVVVGNDTERNNYDNGSVTSNLLHVERAASNGNAGISICANTDTAADAGAILYMGRTSGASNGDNTIVESGDLIGRISFQGADGSQLVEAASIKVDVDGTPGANDMPGRIEFHTTADGGSGATERLRIDSSGRLLLGTTSAVTAVPSAESDAPGLQISKANKPTSIALYRNDTSIASGNTLGGIHWYGNDTTSNTPAVLASMQVQADSAHAAGDNPTRITFSNTADGASSPTERLRIDAAGRLLLGTTTEGSTSADNLTIADSGHCGMTVRSGSSSSGSIYFSDATSGDGEYDGYVQYSHLGRTLNLGAGAATRVEIQSDGDVLPGSDDSQDLGSTSKRWANIYSADLQLSNEGKSNDVDGTWGQYTIQEGENDLFLLNRRNGKKYRFMLEEV